MKNTLIIFLVLLPWFGHNELMATEQAKVDSLNRIIADNVHDTLLAKAFLELSGLLYLQKLDTMIPLCKKAISIADESTTQNKKVRYSLDFIKAQALSNLGFCYQALGDFDRSIKHFNHSVRLSINMEDKRSAIETVDNIGAVYRNIDKWDDALKHFRQCLEWAEETNYTKYVAMANNNIGFLYQRKGEPDSSLIFYKRSLLIREQMGDKQAISTSYNNIGHAYEEQGNVKMALEYYEKSLALREELGYKKGLAVSLNNIAYLYKFQEETELAISYFERSMAIREEIGDKGGVGESLANLGVIYYDKKEYDKALNYQLKSLALRQQVSSKKGEGENLGNIGLIYFKRSFLDSSRMDSLRVIALDYYTRSLKIKEDIGDKDGIAHELNTIAQLNYEEGKIKKATLLAERSRSIGEDIKSPRIQRNATFTLKNAYSAQGNYEKAIEMYELHIKLRDSIKNEETQKATIRQQTKYEFEKAELVKKQLVEEEERIVNQKLKRRDNMQYSIILIAILMVFGVVLTLGFIQVSLKIAEGLIFFSFLILFEFALVLIDPIVENWSGGAPGWKLLANAVLAAFIFPLHAFFERALKKRLL